MWSIWVSKAEDYYSQYHNCLREAFEDSLHRGQSHYALYFLFSLFIISIQVSELYNHNFSIFEPKIKTIKHNNNNSNLDGNTLTKGGYTIKLPKLIGVIISDLGILFLWIWILNTLFVAYLMKTKKIEIKPSKNKFID